MTLLFRLVATPISGVSTFYFVFWTAGALLFSGGAMSV